MRKVSRSFLQVIAISIFCAGMSFSAAAAKVAVPENVRWEDSKACWDEAEDAYQYEVQLYKGGIKYDTPVSTNGTSIDLLGRMRDKGTYTFRVRVRDRITDEYGRFSGESGGYHQEKEQTVKKGTKRTTKKNTKTTAVNTGQTRNPGPGEGGDGWMETEGRWRHQQPDGTYDAGGWFQIGKDWYFFDQEGYMQTGWFTAGGYTYYCFPDGKRAAGWISLDGAYYSFDENGIYVGG